MKKISLDREKTVMHGRIPDFREFFKKGIDFMKKTSYNG